MSNNENTILSLFYMESKLQLPIIESGLQSLFDNKAYDHDILAKSLSAFKSAAKISGLNPIFEAGVAIEHVIDSVNKHKSSMDDSCIDAIKETIVLLHNVISKKNATRKKLDDTQSNINKLIPLIILKNDQCTNKQNDPTNDEAGKCESQAIKHNVTADLSMLELFRIESESQARILSDTLVELENNPEDATSLEILMRAAHSFKGAARMVGLDNIVSLGHVMEDVFVAAQNEKLIITTNDMDILLASVDLMENIADSTLNDYSLWCEDHITEINNATVAMNAILNGNAKSSTVSANNISPNTNHDKNTSNKNNDATKIHNKTNHADENNVRVSTNKLNRLIGIASESQIESRWLQPYATSLLQVKKQQTELISLMDSLRNHIFDLNANEDVIDIMNAAQKKASACRELLNQRLTEMENYERRSNSLSHRLNNEIIKIRMRPFSDGTKGFNRLVRDISHSLDKDINIKIKGLDTQVDRDILDQLQAPLNHLLRNAIDHGIETREERINANKPESGTITIEAVHSAGMLSITIEDDGRGIDLEKLRKKIVHKKLIPQDMAEKLTESELLDFLFLPNFSTRDNVTEISGRGVGLDVVHTTLQEMRGTIRTTTTLGKGMKFQFQLPLTLSVIRALMVKIDNEIYAFPLAHINKTLKINVQQIELMEGRQYFTFGSNHIGLITAHQILNIKNIPKLNDDIPVVILGDRINNYAVVVDEFLGERNLAVHTIDKRLGKIRNINSASLNENGDPLLIFDVDDLLRSIDILLSDGRVTNISSKNNKDTKKESVKRILVVDDSITVRETERNLLEKEGYYVEIAVDGMDGWNATRTDQYDLIISDIDMPRMNGFELVEHIKGDDRFKNIPVIIVSYKDREEDRLRGLDLGADYYLTKGSFHDDTFLEAVTDLIGEA